jgi:hypothetical protein
VRATSVLRLAGALAFLGTCAGTAQAQIGSLRRAVQRAAQGPPPEVRRLLDRIEETRRLFDGATYLLNQSALVMEGVVATEERRAEIRREVESAGTLEQRTGDNRVQLDAEDRATRLEQATQERRFEQRQLSRQQSSNVSAATFNAALAAKMDADALAAAQHLTGEASAAISAIAADPVMVPYVNRLQQAVTTHLPAIVSAVPVQTRLATAIRAAAQQARSANEAVQVTEAAPAAGAAPQTIDVNAI